MTDRIVKAYGARIGPDMAVADDSATEADETLGAAQAWLLSQQALGRDVRRTVSQDPAEV